jgi:squalene cyclase
MLDIKEEEYVTNDGDGEAEALAAYIKRKLDETEASIADKSAVWIDEDEFWADEAACQ